MSIPTLTVSSEPGRPPHSRSTFLGSRPPRLPEATHGDSTRTFLQPCLPRRTVQRVPRLAGPSRSGHSGWRGKRKGTGAHSKLTRTQPANFWAAARNARRPELSRSAEPSRRGCFSPPPGGESPAAPQPSGARPSIHLPNSRGPEHNPVPPRHRRARAHSALTGSPPSRRCPGGRLGVARPEPAIPLGSLSTSLAHPEPFYLQAGCP